MDGMNKVKCGDVFITEDGDFSFICINCSFAFWDFTKYRTHVLENHLVEYFNGGSDPSPDIELDEVFEEIEQIEDNNSDNNSYDENVSEFLTIEKLTEEILNDELSVDEDEDCETKFNVVVDESELPEFKPDIETSPENVCDEIIVCCKCKEKFTSMESLYKHKQNCDSIICPMCLMEISGDVSKHISDCSSKLKKSDSKNTKKEKENCLKKYPCNHCERVFYVESEFRKHYAVHESNIDKCEFCGKRFRSVTALKYHIRRHKGVKPFKCTACPIAFSDKANLKTHFIVRHTEGMKLPCAYGCGKIFKTAELRKRHERYMHQNDRNYLCLSCGVSFKTFSKLNEHMKKKHLDYNDRPYECDFCKKKFVFPKDLKEHRMTHTGEKPNKCQMCTKAFIKKYELTKHIRKKHPSTVNQNTKDK